MCGFAGLLDLQRATPRAELERFAAAMIGPIVHRGPDDAGIHTDEPGGLALGFRRLAVIDLTAAGHQPMPSRSGRHVIVFNGEIYNADELRGDLEARGARFRGRSDTEVILEGVEQWGWAATLDRLNGMFAIALWDVEHRRLALARDRLGKKPLYWGRQGRFVFFASQPKCFLPHPAFGPAIDPAALRGYFRFGYVPAPRSIFKGIGKLAPGSWAEIDANGAVREHRYWDLAGIAAAGVQDPLDLHDDEAVEALEELLGDAVERRMIADVPLGAFLSGGIDSSTIVALMRTRSARPVRTFSIGFHEPAYDEAPYARAVAEHLGTEHTELYVSGDDALSLVPQLPVWFDEPFADASAIPSLLVAELTRRSVTVALSGDGGDELFAGYMRYGEIAAIQRRLQRLPGPVRRHAARALHAVPGAAWHAVGRFLPSALEPARLDERALNLAGLLDGSPEQQLRQVVSHWPRPEQLMPEVPEEIGPSWNGSATASLTAMPERLQLIDMLTYLPDDILVKVDRASMAHALEARCPLLDRRVVEFCWRLPGRMRLRDGQSKWLLRRLLDRHVPAVLIDRPKRGFTPPLAAWLRGPLRDHARELLAPDRLRDQGLVDPQPVSRVLAEHLGGRVDRRFPLWNMLMFQAWHAHWLEAPQPRATPDVHAAAGRIASAA